MSEAKPATFTPLSFAELLDRTFRVYRGNFLTFIGILAVMEIPVQLLTLVFNLVNSTSFLDQMDDVTYLARSNDYLSFMGPYLLRSFSGACLIGLAAVILVQAVASGTLTNAVFHAYLGKPLTIREAYRSARPMLPRLIAVALLGMVITFALVVWWVFVPCIGWITGFGFVVYFAWVLRDLVIPAVVLERQSGLAAFRRAWELARRRFWWVLGFVGVLMLISVVVSMGPAYLVSAVLSLVSQLFSLTETQTFVVNTSVNSLVNLTTTLLYTPLLLTGIALVYLDLRVRTEGLDLVMQLQEPEQSVEGKLDVLARTPSAGVNSWMTGKEFGYILLLSVGAFVVLFGVYLLLVFIGVAFILALEQVITGGFLYPF